MAQTSEHCLVKEQWREEFFALAPLVGLVTLFGGAFVPRLKEISRLGRFAIGAGGMCALGLYRMNFPRTAVRQIDADHALIQLPAKEQPVERSWKDLCRTAALTVLHPVRYALYPGAFVRSPSRCPQRIFIEAPTWRGYPQTHLLEGGRMPGREVDPPLPKNVVVLLFCGNGAAAEDLIDYCGLYYWEAGASLQAVDWRQFNRSGGPAPDVDGTHLDVEAMVDAAMQWYGVDNTVLITHGLSLGAESALYAAEYACRTYGEEKVFGAYADQPFATIGSVVSAFGLASRVFPYDNVETARKLARHSSLEIGIIRGSSDRLMQPNGVENDRNAQPIFEAVKQVRGGDRGVTLTTCGTGHCDVRYDHVDFMARVRAAANKKAL